MNTRLQVEHPITEMVTGWIWCSGRSASREASASIWIPRRCSTEGARDRVPHLRRRSRQRLPAVAGRIQGLRVPHGPGVRDDSGAYEGGEVPIFYDPMISKLITWGDTREHAIQRMRRALAEYQVRGIRATIPFFQWILDDEDFKAAIRHRLHRSQARQGPLQPLDASHEDLAAIAAAVHSLPNLRQRRRAGRRQPLARCRPDGSAAMIFEVAVGDKLRTVGIVSKGGLLHVDLDGRTHLSTRGGSASRSSRCWCSSRAAG